MMLFLVLCLFDFFFFSAGGLRVGAKTNNRKSLLKKTEMCALLCILIGIPLFC